MGYQAITTRYLGATDRRGARIKATASAGSITRTRDYGLTVDADHTLVAMELANKFDWHGRWHEGGLPNGDRVFVLDTGDYRDGFTLTAPNAKGEERNPHVAEPLRSIVNAFSAGTDIYDRFITPRAKEDSS